MHSTVPLKVDTSFILATLIEDPYHCFRSFLEINDVAYTLHYFLFYPGSTYFSSNFLFLACFPLSAGPGRRCGYESNSYLPYFVLQLQQPTTFIKATVLKLFINKHQCQYKECSKCLNGNVMPAKLQKSLLSFSCTMMSVSALVPVSENSRGSARAHFSYLFLLHKPNI